MTDKATKRVLVVRPDPRPGAYVRVSEDQLPVVEQLLEDHAISYYVMEGRLKRNDGPFMARVDLGRRTDVEALQLLFNAVD